MALTVYLSEPDPVERRALASALAPYVGAVRIFDTTEALLEMFDPCAEACVVVGLQDGGAAAVDRVTAWRDLGLAVPVIALGPRGALRTAVDLARLPRTDFLERPVSVGRLRAAMRRVCARAG